MLTPKYFGLLVLTYLGYCSICTSRYSRIQTLGKYQFGSFERPLPCLLRWKFERKGGAITTRKIEDMSLENTLWRAKSGNFLADSVLYFFTPLIHPELVALLFFNHVRQ